MVICGVLELGKLWTTQPLKRPAFASMEDHSNHWMCTGMIRICVARLIGFKPNHRTHPPHVGMAKKMLTIGMKFYYTLLNQFTPLKCKLNCSSFKQDRKINALLAH